MAISDEERRKRERERKARQRREKRNAPQLSIVPDLPQIGGTKSGTDGGTDDGTADAAPTTVIDGLPSTNVAAVMAAIALLDVPVSAQYLATKAITYARGLDSLVSVPQWSALGARLDETMDKLTEASKTREIDPLDQMRRDFYSGGATHADSNPPATRRKASGEA